MQKFNHRGKIVGFWTITGVVLGSDKYSETHVSSSGGGGYVGPHGGHVTAPTVRSSTVTNHEFWIKTEDGAEEDIKFRCIDIPLRKEKKITIISAGQKGASKGWYAALINHNAKKYWHINKADDLCGLMKLETISLKSIVISIALWVSIAQLFDSALAGLFIAIAFLLYRIIVKFSRVKKLATSLHAHIEEIAHISAQSN